MSLPSMRPRRLQTTNTRYVPTQTMTEHENIGTNSDPRESKVSGEKVKLIKGKGCGHKMFLSASKMNLFVQLILVVHSHK